MGLFDSPFGPPFFNMPGPFDPLLGGFPPPPFGPPPFGGPPFGAPFGPPFFNIPGPAPPNVVPVPMIVPNAPSDTVVNKAIIINVAYCTVLDLAIVGSDKEVVTAPKVDPNAPTTSDSQEWDIYYDNSSWSSPGSFNGKILSSSLSQGVSGKLGVTVGDLSADGRSYNIRLGSDLMNETGWLISRDSQPASSTLTPETAPVRIYRDIQGIQYYWTATGGGAGSQAVSLTQINPNSIGTQMWIICNPLEG